MSFCVWFVRCSLTTRDVNLQIPWIKRFDLQATVHDAGGWVVKDPLTLNYALLDDAEYAILNLLDGKTPFPKILAVLRQRFPDRGVGPEDLADFIRHLAGHQLFDKPSLVIRCVCVPVVKRMARCDT